jgi:hypothetical protein
MHATTEPASTNDELVFSHGVLDAKSLTTVSGQNPETPVELKTAEQKEVKNESHREFKNSIKVTDADKKEINSLEGLRSLISEIKNELSYWVSPNSSNLNPRRLGLVSVELKHLRLNESTLTDKVDQDALNTVEREFNQIVNRLGLKPEPVVQVEHDIKILKQWVDLGEDLKRKYKTFFRIEPPITLKRMTTVLKDSTHWSTGIEEEVLNYIDSYPQKLFDDEGLFSKILLYRSADWVGNVADYMHYQFWESIRLEVDSAAEELSKKINEREIHEKALSESSALCKAGDYIRARLVISNINKNLFDDLSYAFISQIEKAEMRLEEIKNSKLMGSKNKSPIWSQIISDIDTVLDEGATGEYRRILESERLIAQEKSRKETMQLVIGAVGFFGLIFILFAILNR